MKREMDMNDYLDILEEVSIYLLGFGTLGYVGYILYELLNF